MKHQSFFRIMWGDPWGKAGTADGTISADLHFLRTNELENKLKTPILVFGKDNFFRLTDMGFSCIIIDRKNSVLPPDANTLLHKVIAWDIAMDMFDAAVFLDIDCHQMRALPPDFWEICEKKASIQAPLIRYARRQPIQWRRHRAILPCGCYVYFRDKTSAELIVQAQEQLKNDQPGSWFNDEPVIAKAIDNMDGGWNGVEAYAALHEPELYSLDRFQELKGPQPPYFRHFWRDSTGKKLHRMGIIPQ